VVVVVVKAAMVAKLLLTLLMALLVLQTQGVEVEVLAQEVLVLEMFTLAVMVVLAS